MPPIKDQNQLDDIRKRLYERGAAPVSAERSGFSEVETPAVSTAWNNAPAPVPTPVDNDSAVLPSVAKKKRFGYRTIILSITFLILLVVMAGTSLYLYFGNNQISSKNINITLAGALTTGGGETYPLEATIQNNNEVPIESAVLIVNFPSGTKSGEDSSKDMLEERIPLDHLNAGETVKVPIKAIIFGEENQEHEIHSTIEYRLGDSNGTFYKEADPLKLKIISSPLVIRVESLEKVSAGQDTKMVVTIQSNASTPLKDLLITAEYPNNFDFTSATPEPSYRENAWLIKELLPEQSTKITLIGSIVGNENEKSQVKFAAGTPQQGNQFMIGSTLANAVAEFTIEEPFIDVGLNINSMEGEVVTLATGETVSVAIKVRNTLSDTLYDMKVEAVIAGNILVSENVDVTRGYYDATTNTIRFEPSGDPSLVQVPAGETREFNFEIKPNTVTETPSFTVTANTYARRVSESRANEELVGTAKSEVKFTSSVAVARQLGRGTAGFAESGPIPPVADTSTTYTILLDASAGGNDVTGGTLTAALPQYVTWLNKTSGDGTITFNPVTKELTWAAGDIEAGKRKQIAFQVSLTPSQTQVGTVPALISTQRFRATDRFTGAVVRAEAMPLNTELSPEAGFPSGNGKVVRSGSVTATSSPR